MMPVEASPPPQFITSRLRAPGLAGVALSLLVIHALTLALFHHSPVVWLLSFSVLLCEELFTVWVCFAASFLARGSTRRFWQLGGTSMTLAAMGQGLAIAGIVLPTVEALGAAADFMFFFAPAPIFVVVFLADEGRGEKISWEWMLDTLQILGLIFVIYLFLDYIPSLMIPAAEVSPSSEVLFLGRDIALAAGLFVRAFFSHYRPSRWLFFWLACIMSYFAAGSWVGHVAQSSTAPELSAYDALWSVTFCLLVLLAAVWHPVPEPSGGQSEISDFSRVIFAYIPSLILPGMLLVNYREVVREQIFVGLIGLVFSIVLFNARLLLTMQRQRRTSDTLRATEEQYRSLFERNVAGVFRATVEGRLLECNPAFAGVLGYSREELNGTPLHQLYFGGVEERNRVIAELRESRQHLPRELCLRRKDASPIWVVVNASVQLQPGGGEMIEGTLIDITESKLTSIAIEEWKRRYDEAVLASGQIVYEIDPQTERVTLGGCTQEILGYTPEELSGELRPLLALIHPSDRANYNEKLSVVLSTAGTHEVEYRARRRDGEYRTLWDQGRSVLNASGMVTRIAGFITDITERRALEAQFRQAQKMEAVGRLAGGIAHDFNNMLTIISGYSSIQMERTAPDDPVHHEAEQIKATSDRAAALTRQLLAFSRQQVMLPRRMNLNDVVRGVDKMLRRLIGEHIEVLTVFAPDLGVVRVDPGQMDQILMNLIINARDAMPNGGKLTIQTQNVELDDAYFEKHGYVSTPHQVLLAVSDNGVGMDAETQARLFEPFFTTKEPGKGTGLGLSMVYGIVKQSGGSIEVYSELDHGTTFKIYLPRVDAPADDSAASGGAHIRARGTERVLLVEDDAQLRQLVASILTQRGYVVYAMTGLEELEQVLQREAEFHLLLTDVVMPRLSGPVVARRVTERSPGVKVLYMSGYTTNAIVHHGVLDEGLFFLQKPFTPTDLAAKVREVLDSPPRSGATR